MQRETNRQKTTGLKLRMYSYTSPPFFSEVREATTLYHDCSGTNYSIHYAIRQSAFFLFFALFFGFLRKYFSP